MSEFHKGLKVEIEFWQSLIIESGLRIHSNECRRMLDALELAQMKLLKFEHELTEPVGK